MLGHKLRMSARRSSSLSSARRFTRRASTVLSGSCLLLSACAESEIDVDVPPDTGAIQGEPPEAGVVVHVGPPLDGGGIDSGAETGTPVDAHQVDAGDCSLGLTYHNFGEHFMHAYCASCHGEWPLYAIVASASKLSMVVGSTYMPFGGFLPSDQERDDFVQWLRCGVHE